MARAQLGIDLDPQHALPPMLYCMHDTRSSTLNQPLIAM
jgi:hypothetical protein